MKFVRVFLFALFFMPLVGHATVSEFTVAAQLLAAAKNADIQQVQLLINNGANVNYVDSTGLSIVCTALMNNDVRAAQILQMYGADASNCDRQIRQFNSRNGPQSSGGGLFGGLSSAQSITLAAAGAAVIVAGLYFLTDWINPGNDNKSSSSSGSRGEGGGGGGSDSGTPEFTNGLPYGPAMYNAALEKSNYSDNLLFYSPSDTSSILYKDFELMNNNMNYLVLMRGYSPLARRYLGMRTLRNAETNAPILLNGAKYGTELIDGGSPVNVALVTANGINAATNTSLENKFLVWTTVNSDNTPGPASQSTISSKYYNNLFHSESVDNYSVTEDTALLSKFDLSNSGTAINNALASNSVDNLIAKIVGGNTSGYENADFIGFMPNGQMTIYRTGGGSVMVDVTPVDAGTCNGDTIITGDEIVLFGKTLSVTMSGNGVILTNKDDTEDVYVGYLGADGLLYIDTDNTDEIFVVDSGYTLSGGVIQKTKDLQSANYMNYAALYDATTRRVTDDYNFNYTSKTGGGRSRVDVVANADVIEPLHQKDTLIIDDVLENASTTDEYQNNIKTFAMSAYSNGSDAEQIGVDVNNFFGSIGTNKVLAVFSTGASIQNTGSSYSDAPQIATFENAAPIAYSGLEHSFMSVVAVGASTTNAAISANSDLNASKYQLSQWQDTHGTTDTSDDTFYKSRICGIAGSGYGDIDPWCFSSVGVTDEMAVASAAGAAGVLRSAFYYMTPQQIFTLLALTADGPYLGRLSSGAILSETTLISHLQDMYVMPGSYQQKIDNGMSYLDAFKDVFGYGVINLERATTPGTNLYFRSGDSIVSVDGNAYWRAATNTKILSSAALSINNATITTAAYDVLESVDGSMSLPRIWETSFAVGNSGRHGLYMGDVLGELKTRRDDGLDSNVGNLSFHMARSERAYNDNLNGLDELRLSFDDGTFHMAMDYQHHLTDGVSRFSGMANPVLALTSNAVTSGISYDFGNWTFGARAFSGAITDDALLENDPTISAQFMPATLGRVSGAQSSIGWNNNKFGFTTSVGSLHETDTLLGAQTDGLIALGAGDTNYVDAELRYSPFENVLLKLRGTYARTDTDTNSLFVSDVTTIESNAFAFGADVGNFSFAIARPLAAYNGSIKVPYANYAIVENDNGTYGIDVVDSGVADLRFGSDKRELRLSGEYRHNFGEFTDGAFGFIYRVNPNNTDEFGNESIFMLKMTHRVGI